MTSGGVLSYTKSETEITLNFVKVTIPRKGIGSALVERLQDIAKSELLPIGLYAEPIAPGLTGNVTISEEGLINFYEKLGFVQDVDSDGKLLIWKF